MIYDVQVPRGTNLEEEQPYGAIVGRSHRSPNSQ
jgi:hypothetical protein